MVIDQNSITFYKGGSNSSKRKQSLCVVSSQSTDQHYEQPVNVFKVEEQNRDLFAATPCFNRSVLKGLEQTPCQSTSQQLEIKQAQVTGKFLDHDVIEEECDTPLFSAKDSRACLGTERCIEDSIETDTTSLRQMARQSSRTTGAQMEIFELSSSGLTCDYQL